jgi:hypothetical protein
MTSTSASGGRSSPGDRSEQRGHDVAAPVLLGQFPYPRHPVVPNVGGQRQAQQCPFNGRTLGAGTDHAFHDDRQFRAAVTEVGDVLERCSGGETRSQPRTAQLIKGAKVGCRRRERSSRCHLITRRT